MTARGRTTIDYKEAERRYVIEGTSVRQICRDMGLASWSSMNEIANREDWKGKRQAYVSAIARRSYETAASTVAAEQNAIKDEAILAGRLAIRKYIAGLNANSIPVNGKDALLWAQFLITEMTPAGSVSTEAPDVRNVTPPDAELLRRVVEAARERVPATGGVGPTALVIAADPRAN